MGDEGTSAHVLVERGKAKNELEELQLTKSDTSKQRPSRTKAPNQEIKRREQAKRIHVEENQSLSTGKKKPEKKNQGFNGIRTRDLRDTGIAEVTGSNPVEALIFFRLLLSSCLNWKTHCEDHSSL